MVKNPLIAVKPNNTKFIDVKHSAGILDDFAVRKNIATKEGTIEKVPVNAKDIANRAYVDSVLSASSQSQPVRALNTVYQNILAGALIVYGSINFKYDDKPDFPCYARLYTRTANPPTTVRQIIGNRHIINFIGIIVDYWEHSFSFYIIVPAGHYYTITTTTGGAAVGVLDVWNESSSTGGFPV